MKTFTLMRDVDESGVSGTGHVAEGVEFANGWCAIVWLTVHASCAFYLNISEVKAIHGHGGNTRILFGDEDDNAQSRVMALREGYVVALQEGSFEDIGTLMRMAAERFP